MNAKHLIAFLSCVYLVGCVAVTPTTPIKHTESTTEEASQQPEEPKAAAPKWKIQHSIPRDSFVIGVDEISGLLILGSQTESRLWLYDTESQVAKSKDLPFVPSVGVDLGSELGIAIFGYRPAEKRGFFQRSGSILDPTSDFLIIRNGRMLEMRLAEPISATNGVIWKKGRKVVLVDSWPSSRSLVTLDLDKIIKTKYLKEEDPDNDYSIPLGRGFLEHRPYDLAIVGNQYIAVSYFDYPQIQILGLKDFRLLGTAKQTAQYFQALLTAPKENGEYFASINLHYRLHKLDTSVSTNLDINEVFAARGTAVETRKVLSVLPAIRNRNEYDTRRVHSFWGAINSVENGEGIIFVVGYSNRLYVSPVIKDISDYDNTQIKRNSRRISLPVNWISELHFSPDGEILFVSAPDDGILMEINLKTLLNE